MIRHFDDWERGKAKINLQWWCELEDTKQGENCHRQ